MIYQFITNKKYCYLKITVLNLYDDTLGGTFAKKLKCSTNERVSACLYIPILAFIILFARYD